MGWVSLLVMALVVVASCVDDRSSPRQSSVVASEFSGTHAAGWIDLLLEEIEEEATPPPNASRILGYAGVALYESAVEQMPEHRTMSGQLRELSEIPSANDGPYDVPTIQHAAMGYLMPLFFEDDQTRRRITGYAESRIERRAERGIDSITVRKSINRGRLVAEVLDARAVRDGYYERLNYEFTAPDHLGAWEPTADGQQPLEPFWHTLEPLALSESSACSPPSPPAFSTEPDSDFYRQAKAVYDATPRVGTEAHLIAEFWADNPGESPTPPGHWMALGSQMVDDRNLDLAETSTLFGLLGVALNDAVISCWHEKYDTYLVRPVTYIQEHIDDEWEPAVSTPPFPEYTSGHSNISAAAAVIFTELIGDIAFEDRTAVDRGFEPREYDDFEDAAEEAAQSRLYGGIHYPVGNDNGLWQGECVADRVLEAVELER